MTTYLDQYNRAALVEQCTLDVDTDHLALNTIWQLDDAIRAEFDGQIQMYQQGLVHSVEFYQSLTFILNRARS